MKDYAQHDATSLAALVRAGEVTPKELVDAAITALEAVDPKLNATVCRLFDQARQAASGDLPEGPFKGVPFVVKDLDGFLAGAPYTMGSRFLQNFIPDHDATVIARLKRSGLVFIAKGACPELGLLGITEPAVHGPTRNPWNLEHTPGGSSGGSAACVAARVVPMAHGGDGGGSIRIPASACGLFGLKATRGRVPIGPDLGEGWGGYVQPGVLTRSVRDSAAILDVMAGPEPGAPYQVPAPPRRFLEEVEQPATRLRIAFSTEPLYGTRSHPDCVAAVEDAARLCESLGHELIEARPTFERGAMVNAYLTQVATGIAVEIHDAEAWVGRKATPADFEPTTWFMKQIGESLSAADLQHARDLTHEASRHAATFFERCDVFLCATMAHPPARIGALAIKPAERLGLAVLRQVAVKSALTTVLRALAENSLERTPNTQFFNQTGLPAMSVPLFWNEAQLPIGVQFGASFGNEATLYRLAAQLEEARPWIKRLPPICT